MNPTSPQALLLTLLLLSPVWASRKPPCLTGRLHRAARAHHRRPAAGQR
ncbi:MAG TPA: hypothetical protein VEZ71_31450 [Archangium sp.]|nr:hypothetical protein [Archangium sp.]